MGVLDTFTTTECLTKMAGKPIRLVAYRAINHVWFGDWLKFAHNYHLTTVNCLTKMACKPIWLVAYTAVNHAWLEDWSNIAHYPLTKVNKMAFNHMAGNIEL